MLLSRAATLLPLCTCQISASSSSSTTIIRHASSSRPSSSSPRPSPRQPRWSPPAKRSEYAPRTKVNSEDDPRLRKRSIYAPATPYTLETIPGHLLQPFRLSLMLNSAKVPTKVDMEAALPKWLAKQRGKEIKELAKSFTQLALKEKTAARLEVARNWAEDMEEQVGILKRQDRVEMAQAREERARADSRYNGVFEEDYEIPSQQKVGEDGVRPNLVMRTDPDGKVALYRPRFTSEVTVRPRPPPPPPLVEQEPRVISPEEEWKRQKQVLAAKFPEGWNPPKRISREAITLLRLLQQSDPEQFTTQVLANRFKISAEAVRRILKSQFELPEEEQRAREQKRLEGRRAEEESLERGGGAGGGERNGRAERPNWAGNTVAERSELERLRRENPSTSEDSPGRDSYNSRPPARSGSFSSPSSRNDSSSSSGFESRRPAYGRRDSYASSPGRNSGSGAGATKGQSSWSD